MSFPIQLLLAIGSVAVLLGLMQIVRKLAARYHVNAELQRKLVHIGTGLYALSLPWIFPERWPVYVLVGVTLLVMLALRLPNSRLGNVLHGVSRQSYGDLLLAISVGLCLFLAGDRLYLYILPIAVLTLADAAAALTGTTYGTKFFQVEDGQKSLEGSAIFFLVTLLISMMCLMLLSPLAPINIIFMSLLVAAFGTLVEADSWRGFDNLFLPLGLQVFLTRHTDSSIGQLLWLVALFVLSIVAFKLIAKHIGLSKHAARVYVTAVFLILAAASYQNAIPLVLVLATHAWCRSAVPCRSKFPDLDVVASLALLCFGSLGLGKAMGFEAVSFLGLVAIGMCITLVSIATIQKAIAFRIGALSVAIAIAYVIRALAINLNADYANWNGPMWPAFAIVVMVAAITPLILSATFMKKRMLKVSLLALIVPLASYLSSIFLIGN